MVTLTISSPEFLRGWVGNQPWFASGRTSVITAGSANDLAPGETLPADSDLDLWCFHDGAPLPRGWKQLVDGVTVETTHFAASRLLSSPETDFRLAPNLLNPTVLFDPRGDIARAVAAASALYRDPAVVARRTASAFEETREHLSRHAQAPDSTMDLLLGVLGLPNVMLVSACRRPTFRKAFIHARDLCRESGQEALYERLLAAAGFGGIDVRAARRMVSLCLEIAAASRGTTYEPFWGDFELQAFRADAFAGFVSRCIDNGDHREAVLQILFMAYWGMLPLWATGSAALAEAQERYDEIVRSAGWADTPMRVRRATELLAFADTRLAAALALCAEA
jgi:hypothetical protein